MREIMKFKLDHLKLHRLITDFNAELLMIRNWVDFWWTNEMTSFDKSCETLADEKKVLWKFNPFSHQFIEIIEARLS